MANLNHKVIEMYSDITVCSIGLIITVILSWVTFGNISKPITRNKHVSHKTLVYIVFVSCIIELIIYLAINTSLQITKSIAPNANQHFICQTLCTLATIGFGIHNFSINLLLINRLNVAFKGSSFALSHCVYYSYIIIFGVLWVVILTFFYIASVKADLAPYNVYTQQPDLTGNGTTCSLMAQQISPALAISYMAVMAAIFYGNVIVWFLFTRKLYKLLKLTSETSNICTTQRISKAATSSDVRSNEFIIVMKNQTFLIGAMIFSTICSWLLQMAIGGGYLFVGTDIVSTIIVIFLTFNFNSYYFKLLKCNKCSDICCKWFERKIIKKVGGANSAKNIEITSDEIKTDTREQTSPVTNNASIATEREPNYNNVELAHANSLCEMKSESIDSNNPTVSADVHVKLDSDVEIIFDENDESKQYNKNAEYVKSVQLVASESPNSALVCVHDKTLKAKNAYEMSPVIEAEITITSK